MGARPARDRKNGAGPGLDGYIYFIDDNSGAAKKVVVQVKIGHVSVNHVRDLIGVIEREKAAIGALITLREPTAPILTEAASAGFYQSENFPEKCPRFQILTIADLLAGKQLRSPACATIPSKKPSARRRARPANQVCFAELRGDFTSPQMLSHEGDVPIESGLFPSPLTLFLHPAKVPDSRGRTGGSINKPYARSIKTRLTGTFGQRGRTPSSQAAVQLQPYHL